jgi:hypothetical protein
MFHCPDNLRCPGKDRELATCHFLLSSSEESRRETPSLIYLNPTFRGHGPDDANAFVGVRLKGVLTPAEHQLAKTLARFSEKAQGEAFDQVMVVMLMVFAPLNQSCPPRLLEERRPT